MQSKWFGTNGAGNWRRDFSHRVRNVTDELDGTAMLKGVAAGAVGGLVGSWLMTQTHKLMSRAMSGCAAGGCDCIGESTECGTGEQQFERHPGMASDPATAKTASAISHAVLKRDLTENEQRFAAPAVHYGFGALMGALYGAVAGAAPKTAMGAGLPFGTLLWLAGDELAVPALNLGKQRSRQPLTEHAAMLAAHLVYGAATDVVRRGLMAAMEDGYAHKAAAYLPDWAQRQPRGRMHQLWRRYGKKLPALSAKRRNWKHLLQVA